MKLLGLDSSLVARKELGTELGCPAQKLSDSAQMNVWLHKTVLQKLAENGGNIPKELMQAWSPSESQQAKSRNHFLGWARMRVVIGSLGTPDSRYRIKPIVLFTIVGQASRS